MGAAACGPCQSIATLLPAKWVEIMQDQERHSILCPNCRKLISADEPHCPYCGIANPGSRWKNNVWTRGFQNPDQLLRALIYLNVGMFILALLLNPRAMNFSLNPFSFLSPNNESLLLLGATGTFPIARFHRWWTLLSASYLHAGILHIAFNMIALKQIGPLIIEEYGPYRMFIIYTVAGVVGFFVSYLAGVAFTLGASAAVCGLIGAGLYYGKSRGGVYGDTVYKQVGGWVIGLFAFGLLVPGINNWGHGGGLVAGALLGLLMGYKDRVRENLFHKMMAGVCAVSTLAILCFAMVTGILYSL